VAGTPFTGTPFSGIYLGKTTLLQHPDGCAGGRRPAREVARSTCETTYTANRRWPTLTF